VLLVLDGAYLVGTEPPVFRRVRRREKATCRRSSKGWPSASAARSSAAFSAANGWLAPHVGAYLTFALYHLVFHLTSREQP
jgi:hypothetical protein